MIGTFTKGQHVRVYPHGYPQQAAEAVVILISGNQKSIAVQFDDKPPFVVVKDHHCGGGTTFAPDMTQGDPWGPAKVTMLAARYDQGPWVEIFGQGHYEIDALPEHVPPHVKVADPE